MPYLRDLPADMAALELESRTLTQDFNLARERGLGFTRVGTTYDADFFKGETSHEYRYELRP